MCELASLSLHLLVIVWSHELPNKHSASRLPRTSRQFRGAIRRCSSQCDVAAQRKTLQRRHFTWRVQKPGVCVSTVCVVLTLACFCVCLPASQNHSAVCRLWRCTLTSWIWPSSPTCQTRNWLRFLSTPMRKITTNPEQVSHNIFFFFLLLSTLILTLQVLLVQDFLQSPGLVFASDLHSRQRV